MLTIVNSAAIHMLCTGNFHILISFLLDKFPGVRWLDPMVDQFPVFQGISIIFSITVALVYVPINSVVS